MPKQFLIASLAGLLTFAISACNGSSEPSGAVATGRASDADAVRLVMDDNRFEPRRVEVPAGREVTVEVTNRDGSSHDFAVRSQGVNTGTLSKGSVATAKVTVDQQPVEFVCTLHSGMTGTLVPVARES